jgi:hypothetical protein
MTQEEQLLKLFAKREKLADQGRNDEKLNNKIRQLQKIKK